MSSAGSSAGRDALWRPCARSLRRQGRGMDSITILKSSSSHRPPGGGADLPEATVATGLKLRGTGGRLTARLVPSGIDQLAGRDWVVVGCASGPKRRVPLEEYSIYKDRVVLKLGGVDSAADASSLV